jgi:hypothetical protein
MCGIFGYYAFGVPLSRQQLLDLIFGGLRRLEYRGYDSAGFSIGRDPSEFAARGSASQPIIIKAEGNITALEAITAEHVEDNTLDTSLVCQHHVGVLVSNRLCCRVDSGCDMLNPVICAPLQVAPSVSSRASSIMYSTGSSCPWYSTQRPSSH